VRAVSAPRIAGLVLAAGLSTRLGRPKQLEVVGGETLLERTVRIAQQAGLARVIVVVREEQVGVRARQLGAIPVFNAESVKGLSTSIRVGVEAAQHESLDGLLLMTCDQIALTAEHLHALCARPEEVSGSSYAGRIAVPAYFPRASFSALLQLEGDTGARELLRGARSVACEDLALDVDTEADLKRAKAFVASQRS
jgi:molybdenum cofactor cytidylyltransferase